VIGNMYTIDLMDVIMFFVLLVIFAFFALLVETLLVGDKNDKVNGIEKNMKVKKYGGKYHSGVREVNTSGKQTVKDVQQKIMDSKRRGYNARVDFHDVLAEILVTASKDVLVKASELEEEYKTEVRREVCNEIIRALNSCDRYVVDSITHFENGNKYPKNEVFVVDDIYDLMESVMEERRIEDGFD
jgi:hypothetical protein